MIIRNLCWNVRVRHAITITSGSNQCVLDLLFVLSFVCNDKRRTRMSILIVFFFFQLCIFLAHFVKFTYWIFTSVLHIALAYIHYNFHSSWVEARELNKIFFGFKWGFRQSRTHSCIRLCLHTVYGMIFCDRLLARLICIMTQCHFWSFQIVSHYIFPSCHGHWI